MASADRIRLALHCMAQETVDQNRTVRCNSLCRFHVNLKISRIIYHFHTAPAKDIRRTHHNRIADLLCDRQRFFHIDRHACLLHRDTKLVHHRPEQISVLSHIDDRRRCSENLYSVSLQICREIQRRLPAELCDHAKRLFFFINAEHILQRQRLKIQSV